MLGYFASKFLRPCATSASSAGLDDHPVTFSVMCPVSGAAAVVFVLCGQLISAFLGPFRPAPVLPLPPFPPPQAASIAISVTAIAAPDAQRTPLPGNHFITALLCCALTTSPARIVVCCCSSSFHHSQ